MQQQQQRLLVTGYVRGDHDKAVPLDVANMIYEYYLLWMDTQILSATEQSQLLDLLHAELTKRNIQTSGMDIDLLFRASDHEFDSDKFHDLCDAKGATITLIHTEFDHVFGGYASQSWNRNVQRITDPTAFLFNARPFVKAHPLLKSEATGKEAVWNYPAYGPIYGQGSDVWISGKQNYKRYGYNGAKPSTYSFDQKELTGVKKLDAYNRALFVYKDYEVFSVSIHRQ